MIGTRSVDRTVAAALLAVLTVTPGCSTAPEASPAGGSPRSVSNRLPGELPPESAGPDTPLSVFDAVSLALRQNPELGAAVQRIAQAEAGLAEARAAWLPALSANLGYLRADAPSSYLFKTIDTRSFELGTDFNDPGAFTNWELGGTLRWNLFRGGARLYENRIAETEQSLRELDRTALENRLIALVIRGYYDVLAAGELIETATASVSTVGVQLADVQKLYEGGATGTRKADVLALEVRLAEARERELRARNARDLAVAALNTLLGFRPARAIELSGDDWRPRELPVAYEAAVREALDRRPELAAAREAVKRADYAASAEVTRFLPRVDLVGRTWLDDPDFRYNRKDTNWAVGVDLVWDLFLGGSRSARVARAASRIEEMRSLDRKATLAVELDVRNAFLKVSEARARLEVTEKSVSQAEKSLDLTSKLYRGGAATITRYLETELALTDARVRLTQARYDLKKAAADLARAMGWCVECARTRRPE